MTIIEFLAARFRAGLSGDRAAASAPATEPPPPREPFSIEGDLGGGLYRVRTADRRRYERERYQRINGLRTNGGGRRRA